MATSRNRGSKRGYGALRSSQLVLLLALVAAVALVASGCQGSGVESSYAAGDEPAVAEPAPFVGPVRPTAMPELPPTWTPTPDSTSTPVPAAEPASTPVAESPAGPVVDQLAPDLALVDLDGNELMLSDLRGKPVLLNFWTTW